MEAVPHVFTTNDDKSVWMAKTKAFIEVATLHYSEIHVDHSVDLGSSVTVLVKGSPDIVDPPFFCVAISMDHAFDLLASLMFNHDPFQNLFDATRIIGSVYRAYGYKPLRPQFTHMGVVPWRLSRPDRSWQLVPTASSSNFSISLCNSHRRLRFSKVHCSRVPLIFRVEHAQTCVWVAQKQDALMRATISRVPMLQHVPEIHREIMRFVIFKTIASV